MKRAFYVVLTLSLLIASLGGSFFAGYLLTSKTNTNPEITKSLNQDTLWYLIQGWRVENKLNPYTKNQKLCDIAINRLNDDLQTGMSNEKAHEGFQTRYGNYKSVISENLSLNWDNEKEALDSWVNSPSHLGNLKKNYSFSCIAIKGTHVVQIFSNCENGCP
jgi:uncharacterized protein YkwD